MLQAHLVHAAPGRARIRIPAKRGDAFFFSELETWLKTCPGVSRIQINPRAASALIHFSGMTAGLTEVARLARQHRIFKLDDKPPPLKTVAEIVAEQMGQANQLLSTGSRGHLDAQSIFFLLFLALGVKQLWRGNIMQPAIPMLWRAVEILRDMNLNTMK
jgi:hypothetical protein